jgi:hypothetical protein
MKAMDLNNKGTKKPSAGLEFPEWKLGLLINFNEVLIKDGIHRILNVPRVPQKFLP